MPPKDADAKSSSKRKADSVIEDTIPLSSAGVGNLVFVEETIDKTVDLNLLKNNLLQSAEKLCIRDRFGFNQDSELKHKSQLVQSWRICNCPHVVETSEQSGAIA